MKSGATAIIVKRETYPSGREYLVAYIGERCAGSIDERAGGYVPCGCRKPLPTLKAAVNELLRRRIRRAIDEANFFQDALRQLPIREAEGKQL